MDVGGGVKREGAFLKFCSGLRLQSEELPGSPD